MLCPNSPTIITIFTLTRAHPAAALVVAALCAKGESVVEGVEYLERGYEDFELVLSSLGADIKKI